eukprot:COSAG05_NODE_314_length_11610_cov_17.223265_4_plen_148_part_00
MRPRIHAAARRRDRMQILLGACCRLRFWRGLSLPMRHPRTRLAEAPGKPCPGVAHRLTAIYPASAQKPPQTCQIRALGAGPSARLVRMREARRSVSSQFIPLPKRAAARAAWETCPTRPAARGAIAIVARTPPRPSASHRPGTCRQI